MTTEGNETMAINVKGTVTFKAFGAYCEEYINELFSRKIRLNNIRNENNYIYADIDRQNYLEAARLARNFGVRTSAVRRKGLYYHISSLKKRPGLIAGILVSAAMVFTLRLFVWHIDVHGNKTITDEQVLGMLENYGFTAGVLANDTDALDAERKILMSTDELSWINIEVNGSRADVYLNEKNDIVASDDLKTPCNIVASRSGVITDTDVSSGDLLYEKGSGVAEGSVIVSGAVSSGDTLILVHSDAKITADFTDRIDFEMDYTTTEKLPSDDSFIHRQLMILGIVIPLDGNNRNTENTICTESTSDLSIGGLTLPVTIRTEQYNRYSETRITRKADDIRRILENRLEMYIYNFCKDYEVLDVQKVFEETGTGLRLKAAISLRGDIGVKKPIYEH